MGRLEYLEYKIKKLFEVKPYKFKELYSLYKVDPKTLRKWLELAEVKFDLQGHYFKIHQVGLIIERLGMPYLIYDIDYDSSDVKCERREFKRPFEVRPYKFHELASLYNVSPKTFREVWLAPLKLELGALVGGYYLIPQIEIIVAKIGLPYFIYESGESQPKVA
jgi:hypothetical protein